MGLVYFILMVIWFGVLWWVAKGITWLVDFRYKRLIATIVIVVGYPLPIADEIIGAVQFSRLCKHQMIYKDPEMAKKKGARLIYVHHERKRIDGVALAMTSQLWEFVYESDKSLMLSYVVFRTGQGRLTRYVQINEGSSPLIFSGVCSPKEEENLFLDYKIIN